ncbi:MFS transporter [Kitasatospora xanthocidica]|uniref:MFS transporter n=1 Tax=Kitasatospora xanthocidica TaxID=83382 RepID=A0A373A5T8_9ACTN|nr:MFS transporter [Kitasatospora xanthocidica]RGD62920.1 MFS transporter [Kitasatospora xanthocidica]
MACLGVFVAYLPVTTVSVSLPALQRVLGASTSQLSWVSDAFVLPMAALILTTGVWGDVHGRKRVFQAGMAFCALGAAVSLTADSVQLLWVGQAASGLGAAALLPTTLALISHAVPDHRERGRFIGLWAMSMLASLAMGPLIAGLLQQHVQVRWIFLLPIPVSLVVLVVAAFLLPDSRAPHGRRLDWPGQISAAVTVTAVVYGVIEGGADGFGTPSVVAALVIGAVSAVAFVLVERRSDSPMLDLALFRSPAFAATSLVAMISFLGLIGFFFVLSLYFGLVQHLSTWEAGLRMVLVSGTSLVAGVPVGRLMHRVSPRVMITTGLVVMAGSLLSLTGVDAATSYGSLAWRLVLLGLGIGAVLTPMTASAVSSVPHHLAGMAAAGNNAFRQLGGALGPAVLGTLLTTRALDALPGRLTDAGVPTETGGHVLAVAREQGLGAVAGLDLGPATRPALSALSGSFLDGLQLCLVVSASLALLAALACAVLLRPAAPAAPGRPGTGAPAPRAADGPVLVTAGSASTQGPQRTP